MSDAGLTDPMDISEWTKWKQTQPAMNASETPTPHFMSPSEHGKYWHDLAQERIAEIVRLRDELAEMTAQRDRMRYVIEDTERWIYKLSGGGETDRRELLLSALTPSVASEPSLASLPPQTPC